MKLSDILNDYITQKNEIDKLNDVLKEKKNKLYETKNTIIQYMNKKTMKELNYNDNKFCIKTNKTYSSFTQKYLKDTIKNYFDNNQDKINVDNLIKFIITNRQEIIQSDLQFSLNK
tara:strand:+ start:535 stop:882 length:348 start_codon:yes stop_codon:yes gene_type:complete